MKLTLLGTGTSQGVPIIGCDCEVCISANPKDKRLRTSALIQSKTTSVVVDAGPDFRQQMLHSQNRKLDALLFTHAHKDHTAGLDDIRPFYFQTKKAVPLFGLESTLSQIRIEFGYMFTENKYPGVADVELNALDPLTAFSIGDIEVLPLLFYHAKLPVLGFRIADTCYVTDVNEIPPETFSRMKGSKTLILNALRKTPHPSHFTLDEAIGIAQELGVTSAYFTHISHSLGLHEAVSASLPKGCYLGWDGLSIEI